MNQALERGGGSVLSRVFKMNARTAAQTPEPILADCTILTRFPRRAVTGNNDFDALSSIFRLPLRARAGRARRFADRRIRSGGPSGRLKSGAQFPRYQHGVRKKSYASRPRTQPGASQRALRGSARRGCPAARSGPRQGSFILPQGICSPAPVVQKFSTSTQEPAMSTLVQTIAVLGGTGAEGRGLAPRSGRAGHRVILGFPKPPKTAPGRAG